jgi:hypothetical protein
VGGFLGREEVKQASSFSEEKEAKRLLSICIAASDG